MDYIECICTFGATGKADIDCCTFLYSCEATRDANKAIMHIAAIEVVIIRLDNILVRGECI